LTQSHVSAQSQRLTRARRSVG